MILDTIRSTWIELHVLILPRKHTDAEEMTRVQISIKWSLASRRSRRCGQAIRQCSWIQYQIIHFRRPWL